MVSTAVTAGAASGSRRRYVGNLVCQAWLPGGVGTVGRTGPEGPGPWGPRAGRPGRYADNAPPGDHTPGGLGEEKTVSGSLHFISQPMRQVHRNPEHGPAPLSNERDLGFLMRVKFAEGG